MFHPFFKVVKKTYIALIMLSIVHYIPAQVPETAPLPGGNQVECLSGLTIKNFSSHNNTWKVVVSGMDIEGKMVKEKIKYKAIGHDPNSNLTWKLFSGVGSEDYWDLKPLNSTTWNSTGEAYIPYEKHPVNNSDFGEANGIVKLTSGSQSVLSTDPIPNPGKAIQVYFRKDDPNYFDKNVPNWFYYWSQLVANNLSVESIPLFDENTQTWNSNPSNITFELIYCNSGKFQWQDGAPGVDITYGENTFGFRPSKIEYPLGSGIYVGKDFNLFIPIIKIGQANGYWDLANPSIEGIQCFYETVLHEIHHTNLFLKMYPDGYTSALDADLDGYADSEELIYNNTNPSRKQFKLGDNNHKDKYKSYNYSDYLLGTVLNAATMYEEDLCRIEQKNGSNSLNSFDWSYDPNNKVIGKNWNK
jgi:hypothetical protein